MHTYMCVQYVRLSFLWLHVHFILPVIYIQYQLHYTGLLDFIEAVLMAWRFSPALPRTHLSIKQRGWDFGFYNDVVLVDWTLSAVCPTMVAVAAPANLPVSLLL